MKKITIYTRDLCPYCSRAKQLLKSLRISFEEIDITRNAALMEEMIIRAGGRRTLPQIFVGDLHIGGFDDLNALHLKGKLMPLLKNS